VTTYSMNWEAVISHLRENIQRDASTASDALNLRRDTAEYMKLSIANHVLSRVTDALAVGVGAGVLDPIPAKTKRRKANRGD